MEFIDEQVKIGEIFEVKADKICVHTKLQEKPENGELVVMQPTLRGIPLRSEDGVFRFSFFRPNGVFSFDSELVSSYEKNGIKLCLFRQITEVKKIQRRQCYRLPIALNVIMETEKEHESFKGITVTLSEMSVQVSCVSPIPVETKLTVKIYFSATETIVLKGIVYKCTKPLEKNGLYDIVILFADNKERHITRLSRYIFKQQIIARNK